MIAISPTASACMRPVMTMAVVDRRAIVLPARAQRAERVATLELRFGAVNLARPQTRFLRHLPESLPLSLVDVREIDPPSGPEPLHWRLLTTHPVANAEQAWRIVEWYKRRWLIEQFFRVLKTQGFKLEDSQIATADRLLKLVAIAAKAAVITIQLLQARDGRGHSPSGLPSTSTRSQRSSPSTKISRPKASASGTRILPTVLPGPPGSSAASAAGTAIHPPNRQVPSPSSTAWNTSTQSPQDGASEMCACPRAFAGTTMWGNVGHTSAFPRRDAPEFCQ